MADEPRGPLTPSGPPLGGDREIVYRRRRSWLRRHLSTIVPVVVVVVVVGAIAAAVFAVRNVGDATPSELAESVAVSVPEAVSVSPTPSAATSIPSTAAGPTQTTATGTVVAVLAPGSWTVSVQTGLDLKVVTTSTTVYERGRSADDVVADSRITVVGTIDNGVITATTVTIEKKTSAT